MAAPTIAVAVSDLNPTLQAFGVQGVTGIELLHGGFNANWRIKTPTGEYVLKRRPRSEAQRSIKEATVSNSVDMNIPTAQSVFTKEKSPHLVSGDWCFTLFKYITGRKYDNSSADLLRMARTLAEMHRATQKIDIGVASSIPDFAWTAMEWGPHHMEDSEKIGFMDSTILQAAKDHMRSAIDGIKAAESTGSLVKTFVHWDFHPGNVLFTDTDVYVFDLEFSHLDHRVADIANTIILLASLDTAKLDYTDAGSFIQPCAIDMEKFRSFMTEYSRVFPLTSEEAHALPDYLKLAWAGWVFYTFNRLESSRGMQINTNYFMDWVEKNRYAITDCVLNECSVPIVELRTEPLA